MTNLLTSLTNKDIMLLSRVSYMTLLLTLYSTADVILGPELIT